MNLFQARIDRHEGRLACMVGTANRPLPLPDSVLAQHPRLADHQGRAVAIGIRPDYLTHAPCTNEATPVLEGRVKLAEVLGAEQLVHLELDADPVLTDEIREIATDTDAALADDLGREASRHRVPIIARIDAEIPMPTGETSRLILPPERLHFFDLATGASLRSDRTSPVMPLPPTGVDVVVP